mmetsp:Transcript_43318/g.101434  ORF Transcript_43318/g.101434 Transcript_43318/m.101434 type:complete len:243 (-) Transcript_43318:29-757(-)
MRSGSKASCVASESGHISATNSHHAAASAGGPRVAAASGRAAFSWALSRRHIPKEAVQSAERLCGPWLGRAVRGNSASVICRSLNRSAHARAASRNEDTGSGSGTPELGGGTFSSMPRRALHSRLHSSSSSLRACQCEHTRRTLHRVRSECWPRPGSVLRLAGRTKVFEAVSSSHTSYRPLAASYRFAQPNLLLSSVLRRPCRTTRRPAVGREDGLVAERLCESIATSASTLSCSASGSERS